MSQARFYDPAGIPLVDLAGAAADFFRQDQFDAGFFTDYANRIVLNIGRESLGRQIFGLAYSLTVVFTPQSENQVLIELGGESWGDKVASGAIGLFFFQPLLFTAAYGAWKQSSLDDRFWDFLNSYITQRTGRPPNVVTAVPNMQPNYQYQGPYSAPPPPPANYNQQQGYQAYQNSSFGYVQQGQVQPTYGAPTTTRPPNQRASWFDPQTMQPIFENQVGRMASWQTVMADGVIDYTELNAQQERVAKMQKGVEDSLDRNIDAKLKLAEVMTELGKLEELQRTVLTRIHAPEPQK